MRTSAHFRQQATSKVEQQRRSLKRKRFMLRASLFTLCLCLLIWGGLKLADPNTVPVRAVKIMGDYSNVDHKVLHDTILPFLSSGFLGLDTNGLRNQLLQNPWIETASVQRLWPNTLQIYITEKKPVAHWNNNDLLTANGDTFDPGTNTGPSTLPWLNGPPGQQQIVMTNFQQYNAMIAPLGVKVTWIALTPRQAWELKLNNGILLVLGKNDIQTRLQRFISVYNQVFASHTNDVAYVDLRYSNGLAVRWKNINNTTTVMQPEMTQ